MGLPGSGKTYLANELADLINAVHYNADDVRNNINSRLGFSHEDRIKQAITMRWLCEKVIKRNYPVIADFVCPTKETREAFGECYLIFMDTIKQGRFDDTNKIFERPENYYFLVNEKNSQKYAQLIINKLNSES